MKRGRECGRGLQAKTARAVRVLCLLAIAGCTIARSSAQSPKPSHRGTEQKLVYVGTYTKFTPNGISDGLPPSKGIYMARFNPADGSFGPLTLAAPLKESSFMAVTRDHRFLYAISEAVPEAYVAAYAIDPKTGALRLLNRLPTGGSQTCFIALDRTEKNVLMASYGSGSISVIHLAPDGSLGELTSFVQHMAPARARADDAPHPHEMVPSPGNHFIVNPDLGLNKLFVYRFDPATGTLDLPASIVDLPPNEGPRHFVFSKDGRFGYLIAQTTGHVLVFTWNEAEGKLSLIQVVPTTPPGLEATNLSAEIQLTPDGRFLYESNRRSSDAGRKLGPDSIVGFRINPETGKLTQAEELALGDDVPRFFMIDSSGRYLLEAGQQVNRINVYRIAGQTGKLTKVAQSGYVHMPVCLLMIPAP